MHANALSAVLNKNYRFSFTQLISVRVMQTLFERLFWGKCLSTEAQATGRLPLPVIDPRYDFSHRVQSLRKSVYDTLGWVYIATGGAPSAFMPLQHYGLITSHSGQYAFRGRLVGRAYGTQNFKIADVMAAKRLASHPANEPQSGGFEGIIVSLDQPTRFEGRTIIRTERGPMNPNVVDEMKRVGFVDRAFENIFEVYSDDQVQARALITPDFMERLMAFAGDYLGRGVQIAFLGHKMHISLNIGDRFDFTREFKAFDFKEASSLLYNEVGAIFNLLEQLQTMQSRIGRHGHSGADQARHGHYRQQLSFLMEAVNASEPAWRNPYQLPDDMRHTHYLFCDSLKGLLSPRM